METKLIAAIEVLAGRINGQTTTEEALKFTQAALNATHALAMIRSMPPSK